MSFSGVFSELVGLIMTRNSAIIVGSVSLPLILLRFLFKFLLKVRWQYIVSKYPRDVVILHQFPRGYRIPSVSPFVLKLETWLRMNNIKYENKHGYTFGPKGKLPFITYNGEDVADSQFIIEYLSKKLNKGLNGGFSPKDLGAARAFNKMTEESLFWVSGLSRFVYEPNPRYFGMHPLALKYLARTYRSRTKVQGYGLHSKDEVFTIGKTDLKSLNDFLEGKKFLIGDKPCNEDASVFGIVGQFVYTENATMNKFILNECPNILNYIENIKTTYWPDWNECIARKKND